MCVCVCVLHCEYSQIKGTYKCTHTDKYPRCKICKQEASSGSHEIPRVHYNATVNSRYIRRGMHIKSNTTQQPFDNSVILLL